MSLFAENTGDSALVVGHHDAAVLGGTQLVAALDALAAQSPELSQFLVREEFGDLTSGAALEPREWAMLILSCLATMGDSADQLVVYAQAALANGATEGEIQDVLKLIAGYVGAPRAVTAARAIASHVPAAVGAPRQEKVVRLSDHETGVELQGVPAGVPILMMHALCMDRHYWRAVAPALAHRAPVICYDLRAHGRARGGPLPTSLDQMADDAATLLDRLEVERADVCGASYGGAVAQHLALRHPDRVRALTLIATGAQSPREPLRRRAEKAESAGMAAQVPESMARWFLPETIANNAWPVRYARSRVLRARVEDWAASWRNMADLDVRERLSEITAPTLVVSGVQDLSSTPEMMKALADGLPNSRFVPVDPGTHMLPIEQPEALVTHFLDFRATVDSAG